MNKKSSKLLMIILGLALILSACGKSGGDKDTIRLGLVCGSLNPYLAVAALNDGSFKDAGITVEKTCFTSGADAVQALIGGSIDINLGSYEHVLRQRSNGLDVKAYAGLYNGLGYILITKNDSPYQTVSDLKGKTLGVTKSGSLSDTGLRMILNSENIDPDKDVTIIGAGSGATMQAALESDQVAAGMITEPVASLLTSSGDYRILIDPPFDYVGLVAMAKPDWVDKHKDAVKTFLKVLKDVHAKTEKDPEAASKAVASEFDQIPAETLQAAIVSELKKMPADLSISKSGADGVVSSQIDLGAISKDVPFEDTIDLSLLPK